MDFYQVLEKRRTIRDFSDKKVTDEVLEKYCRLHSKPRLMTICGSLSLLS